MLAAAARFVAVGLIATGAAHAAEIKLLSSPAVREAFAELVPRFEAASGHKVVAIWGSTPNIAARIAAGEAVDLVIIAAADIDRLIADGKLAAGSRVDIAKSGIGVAVRTGLPKVDISTPEAIKSAALDAKSIAVSSGVSGLYVVGLFEAMGIGDRIKGKLTRTRSGVMVSDVLGRGEADLGFQQISELIHAKGIQYLGPLPAGLQRYTIFASGLPKSSAAPEAAKALIRILVAPDATPVFRKYGMEPS